MRFSAISSRGFSASAAILSRAAYIAAVNAARIRLSSQHFCPRPNNTARIVSDAGFSVPVPEPTTQPRTKAAKSIKKSVPKEKVRAQEETEVNVFNEPILRHRVSDDKLNPSPAIKRRRRNAKIVLVENNQIQTTTQATVIKWAEQIRNFVVEEYQSKTTVVEQEKQSQTIVVEQDEQIQTAVFGQQDPIKKEFRSQTAAFEHENQSQATIIGTEDQAINEISASIEFSSVASSMLPSFLDTLDLYSLPKVLTPAQRNIPVIICDSMDTLPQTLDACRGGIVSFDCEWRVPLRVGLRQPKISLIQIYNGSSVCLFRINSLTNRFNDPFPQLLEKFIQNDNFLKVGMNIRGDASKIYRDFKLKLSGFVELSAFAKKVCPERFQRNGKSQRASLNLLAQVMLGINLNKSDELRLCNWEASRLRQEQIDYAAIDAIVGLEVFNSLNKLAEDRNILVEKESYIPRDEEVPEDEGYKN